MSSPGRASTGGGSGVGGVRTIVRRAARKHLAVLLGIWAWVIVGVVVLCTAAIAWGNDGPHDWWVILVLIPVLGVLVASMYERVTMSSRFEGVAYTNRRVRQFRQALRPTQTTMVTVRLAIRLGEHFGGNPNAVSMVSDSGEELFAVVSWHAAHRLQLSQDGWVVGRFAPGADIVIGDGDHVVWPLSRLEEARGHYVLRSEVPKAPWH